jgi:hypothetical protein
MTSKAYESITFEVEKDLKKPEEFYPLKPLKEIFSTIFTKKKSKLNTFNLNPNTNESEAMEVLHFNFDTEETEIYNYKKTSLISGLIHAYKNHYPITVSPDMLWILILQGYSRFMEQYSELVRERYVNFEGQKRLCVERIGIFPRTAQKETWQGIIQEYIEKIGNNIGNEVISNLEANFTTTTPTILTTSQVSILSAMKQYFSYSLLMGGCGISSITLEGSVEDWQKMKSKLEFLETKALKWWTKHLIPIIDNIIETKEYYEKNNTINDKLIEFWKGMIRLKEKDESYDPDVINGWIIKFIPKIPNNSEEKPTLYEELRESDVPDEIICCPLEIISLSLDGKKQENFKCDFASGFYGMIQDKENYTVKPVIGYAIVVNEVSISKLTIEQKNKIIEDFFS